MARIAASFKTNPNNIADIVESIPRSEEKSIMLDDKLPTSHAKQIKEINILSVSKIESGIEIISVIKNS